MRDYYVVGCGMLGSRVAAGLVAASPDIMVHAIDDDVITKADPPIMPEGAYGVHKVVMLALWCDGTAPNRVRPVVMCVDPAIGVPGARGPVIDCRDSLDGGCLGTVKFGFDNGMLTADTMPSRDRFVPGYVDRPDPGDPGLTEAASKAVEFVLAEGWIAHPGQTLLQPPNKTEVVRTVFAGADARLHDEFHRRGVVGSWLEEILPGRLFHSLRFELELPTTVVTFQFGGRRPLTVKDVHMALAIGSRPTHSHRMYWLLDWADDDGTLVLSLIPEVGAA